MKGYDSYIAITGADPEIRSGREPNCQTFLKDHLHPPWAGGGDPSVPGSQKHLVFVPPPDEKSFCTPPPRAKGGGVVTSKIKHFTMCDQFFFGRGGGGDPTRSAPGIDSK